MKKFVKSRFLCSAQLPCATTPPKPPPPTLYNQPVNQKIKYFLGHSPIVGTTKLMTTSHKCPRPLLKMTVLEFSIAFNLFHLYFSDHLM